MNKIIIIDDKIDRKKNLSDDTVMKLKELQDVGKLAVISNLHILDELNDYSCIAIHGSYPDSKIMNGIKNYVEENHKNLIIFSGGRDVTMLNQNGTIANVNASKLYNDNLPQFILQYCEGNMDNPLLQFAYGKDWHLALLTQYRYLFWQYSSIDNIDSAEDMDHAFKIENILWPGGDNLPKSLEDLNIEISKEISKSALL